MKQDESVVIRPAHAQKVVDAMRLALTVELRQAIATYEAKPRTQWLFDFSVQSTIVASRLYFTADINAAFDDLEEGNEDALKVLIPISYCEAYADPLLSSATCSYPHCYLRSHVREVEEVTGGHQQRSTWM